MSRAALILVFSFLLLGLTPAFGQLNSGSRTGAVQELGSAGRSATRISTADSFVNTDVSRLHYVEGGQGRAVVLLHGNPGDGRDFGFGAMDLIGREYHVYAFDLPGHGLSEPAASSKHTSQKQVAALHQALTNLGIRDPILVGHSWGGSIALAYAILYPQDLSGLVLLAPSAYPDKRYDLPIHLLGMPLIGDVLIATFKPMLGKKFLREHLAKAFSPDPVPDEYLSYAAGSWLSHKHFKVYLKDELRGGPWLRRMKQDYAKIKTPVIIVTGDSDRIIKPARNAFALHRAIVGSKLVVIPNAGHEIPFTHPDVILQAIHGVNDTWQPE